MSFSESFCSSEHDGQNFPVYTNDLKWLHNYGIKVHQNIFVKDFTELWTASMLRGPGTEDLRLICKKIWISKLALQEINLSLDEALKMIQKEQDQLETLKHPNLVTAFHMYNSWSKVTNFLKPISILVFMEQLDGSLKDLLQMNGDMTEDQTKKWFAQAACGLQYLHRNKIAHCNVKPGNVLYTSNTEGYQFRLSDVHGMCKILRTEKQRASSEGDMTYIAPELRPSNYQNNEQWECSLCESDQQDSGQRESDLLKSDVYSLGVCLIKSLTINHDLVDEILWLTNVYVSFESEELKKLVRNIVERDPEDRFSMNQVTKNPWVQSANYCPGDRCKLF